MFTMLLMDVVILVCHRQRSVMNCTWIKDMSYRSFFLNEQNDIVIYSVAEPEPGAHILLEPEP